MSDYPCRGVDRLRLPAGEQAESEGLWSGGGDDLRLLVPQDALVKLCTGSAGELAAEILDTGSIVESLVWSPEGRAAAATNQTVRVWDGTTGQPWDRAWPVLTRTNETWGFSSILSLRFSPDSSAFAVASSHGTVVVWQIAELQRRFEVRTGAPASRVAWSPDGRGSLWGRWEGK